MPSVRDALHEVEIIDHLAANKHTKVSANVCAMPDDFAVAVGMKPLVQFARHGHLADFCFGASEQRHESAQSHSDALMFDQYRDG